MCIPVKKPAGVGANVGVGDAVGAGVSVSVGLGSANVGVASGKMVKDGLAGNLCNRWLFGRWGGTATPYHHQKKTQDQNLNFHGYPFTLFLNSAIQPVWLGFDLKKEHLPGLKACRMAGENEYV